MNNHDQSQDSALADEPINPANPQQTGYFYTPSLLLGPKTPNKHPDWLNHRFQSHRLLVLEQKANLQRHSQLTD